MLDPDRVRIQFVKLPLLNVALSVELLMEQKYYVVGSH